LCVAARSNRLLLVSSRPDGGAAAWEPIRLHAGRRAERLEFDWVACPRTRLCVAADFFGRLAISTDPLHSWKLVRLLRNGSSPPSIASLTCVRAGLCLVGTSSGALYRSRNPAGGARTFTRLKLSKRAIEGLSCASAKLCVAIDGAGRAWSSSTPAGPASTWRFQMLSFSTVDLRQTSGGLLTAVACAPGSSQCVTGDIAGRVFSGR